MKNILISVGCMFALLTVKAQTYSIDDINKSVFLYPDFYKGKVLFKDKTIQEATFNYNTLFQQMIYVQNGVMRALDMPGKIDTVFVENNKFIPSDTVFYKVKLEHTNFPLYIYYSCDLSKALPASPYGGTTQTGAADNLKTLRNNAATPYQLKVPDNYNVERHVAFFAKANDQLVQVKNMKQFTALFPGKEETLKKYNKENRPAFKDEHDMELLFQFSGALR